MSDQTENILFETSPYGLLDGIVEHDGHVVYFYLKGRSQGENQSADGTKDRFGMRACWVRNLEPGPLVIDRKAMSAGKAPLLPRTDCVDPNLIQTPVSDDLDIVWFEEGNGAALLERNVDGQETTIAVIPPWSGVEGFHGYASNCAYETSLAWPMPKTPSLQMRVNRAREFWSSFTASSSPFSSLQPDLLQIYDRHFGSENQRNYYSIDGGKFPQRGLVQYQREKETILLTVAMSMCPQPAAEMFVDHPSEYRRIELGVRIPHAPDPPGLRQIDSAIRSISAFAAYPWNSWTWLGPGHKVAWETSSSGKATLARDTTLTLPMYRNDPVHILWIQPE